MNDCITRDMKMINKRGLHARATAKFVQTVNRFDAQVFVEKDGNSVVGTSIMGIMMLAASQGTTISVTAVGVEASAVIEELNRLITDRFGEDE